MLYKRKLIIGGITVLCALPFLTLISGGGSSESNIGLVTDAGSIFDRSFNQSSWEGIIKVRPKASTSLDAIQPIRHNPSDLVNAYSVHVTGKKKYVVAPGFYHAAGIQDWNKEGYENLLNFIILDSVANERDFSKPFEDFVEFPNVASVIFETAAAGFLAGHLASLYLNAQKDLGIEGYKNPKIGMWGGGPFAGVTDFMVGVVYGVLNFNATNPTKKVGFARFQNEEQYTDSGFSSGGGAPKAKFLLDQGAQVLLPVAGPQATDAIAEIQKTPLNNQKVIGVDSDGAIRFPNRKKYFITSILKGLTDSVVGIYRRLTGQPTPDYFKGLGEVTVGTLANGLTNISNNTEDSDGGWAGIPNAQNLYEDSTSSSMIATALAGVAGKRWKEDALVELRNF